MDPVSILMVEDNVDLATLGVRYLQREGFQVFVKHSGQDALNFLAEVKPGIIFLDLTLPDMGPVNLLKAFLPLLTIEKIPLVLVSGNDDIKEWANQFNTPHFLLKPYTRSQLVELVSTVSQANPSPD